MSRKYIVSIFIFFISSAFIDCSSAEQKELPLTGNETGIKNTAGVNNFYKETKLPEKKLPVVKTPPDFIPVKPEIITYSNDDIKVTLFSKQFAQGNGVYAEIQKSGQGFDVQNLRMSYKNADVPVTRTSWGFRSLWGIDPEEKPGYSAVIINYTKNGKDMVLASDIRIKDVEYPVSKSMLNVGKFSDKNYTSDPKFKDLIAECSALRKKAFSSVSEDCIGNIISHPRDMHKITGDYWRKRIYLTYKKKNKKRVAVEGRKRFHRGVDLKGAVGTPVFAMADGIVVLSHTMFFEGNMVIVDHGNQVFSYYQHLDSRDVKEGDLVKAGDKVGGVGETGMVTGPHLHVAFSIRGVHVDPLSILSLPVSR